jgi:hypothetical protein
MDDGHPASLAILVVAQVVYPRSGNWLELTRPTRSRTWSKKTTNSDTSHARITAANAILDRAWGRPTQPIAGDADTPPVQLSVEERVALARQSIEEAFREVVREPDNAERAE